MKKVTRISFLDQPLFRAFLDVPDPRVGGRCLYPLFEIIFITLCALIAGCDSWKSIENFGKSRRRWLSQFVELKNGIPSHLTFARVFSRIDPVALEHSMRHWVAQIVKLMMWDIINIDGKTARGSGHSNSDKRKMHLINAYHARKKVSLGSEKTPDKSNEIKGIPILLKSLNITGTIITIDAMGSQKGIANLIRENKAHYVLALKKITNVFIEKLNQLSYVLTNCNMKTWCNETLKQMTMVISGLRNVSIRLCLQCIFLNTQKSGAILQQSFA